MAGFGHFKVISVDYRMPPDHPYPAALDDAMTVWKAAVKMADPKNMAIFGSSAGGALTLSMVLRAKQDHLPLPAAIAPGTPMSDLTGGGDSFPTNAMLDNVLVAYDASCDARAALYANGHDLKDPLLSPIYGDTHGFPPAIPHHRDARSSASAIRCACIASCARRAWKRCCRFMRAKPTPNITEMLPRPRPKRRSRRSLVSLTSTSENSVDSKPASAPRAINS